MDCSDSLFLCDVVARRSTLVNRFGPASFRDRIHGCRRSLTTIATDAGVERDSVQPREELTLPLEGRQFHERLHERFLRNIFGFFVRPCDSQERMKKPILIPGHQLTVGLYVPGDHRVNNLGVSQLGFHGQRRFCLLDALQLIEVPSFHGYLKLRKNTAARSLIAPILIEISVSGTAGICQINLRVVGHGNALAADAKQTPTAKSPPPIFQNSPIAKS